MSSDLTDRQRRTLLAFKRGESRPRDAGRSTIARLVDRGFIARAAGFFGYVITEAGNNELARIEMVEQARRWAK